MENYGNRWSIDVVLKFRIWIDHPQTSLIHKNQFFQENFLIVENVDQTLPKSPANPIELCSLTFRLLFSKRTSFILSIRFRCTRTFESPMVRRWSSAIRTVAFEVISRWASTCSMSGLSRRWCVATGLYEKDALRRSVRLSINNCWS